MEFLPDADAIERTPLPWVLRVTTHTLALAFLAFILWATFRRWSASLWRKGVW